MRATSILIVIVVLALASGRPDVVTWAADSENTWPIAMISAGYMGVPDRPLDVHRVSNQITLPLLQDIVAIGAGYAHTCGVTTSGGVKCWGANGHGQLGDGTTFSSSMPVDVVGLGQRVVAIAAGQQHTCVLSVTGGVKCWGDNSYGQLGDGTTISHATPVEVIGLDAGVLAITAGQGHTCALTAVGALKCWGVNFVGQLGDGTTIHRSAPVDVVDMAGSVVAIASGGSHSCALTVVGITRCWGSNSFGQLGDGTTMQRNTPVDVVGLSGGVTSLAAGRGYTCALTANGGIKCWGDNLFGQLGDGTRHGRLTPVDVIGLSGRVADIAAGGNNTCALLVGGIANCWGQNNFGQVGDGTMTIRTVPVPVSGMAGGATAIAIGNAHACALAPAGTVKCWGDNGDRQLGDGTRIRSEIPMHVAGTSGEVAAVVGGEQHTCALGMDGGVACWGTNWGGQLGDGTQIRRSTPGSVVGLGGGVTAIDAGAWHTCALTATGDLECWGWNLAGQLGDGTTTYRSTPVRVWAMSGNVATVSAGGYHTCALTMTGGVKCWGYNAKGQLGIGTTNDRHTPVDVVGLGSGVVAIVAGRDHTCAMTTTGTVKCWGANVSGQLGDGTTIDRHLPVDVQGLSGHVTALAAGWDFTCALTTSGGVKCWGSNSMGQLGDGSTIQQSTPVDVVGLDSHVTAIATGGNHVCALDTAGRIKCWGYNTLGQVGDSSTINRSTPVDVTGLVNGMAAIAAGGLHTCALTSMNSAQCWGNDNHGQLGIGAATFQLVPVDVVDARKTYMPWLWRAAF